MGARFLSLVGLLLLAPVADARVCFDPAPARNLRGGEFGIVLVQGAAEAVAQQVPVREYIAPPDSPSAEQAQGDGAAQVPTAEAPPGVADPSAESPPDVVQPPVEP